LWNGKEWREPKLYDPVFVTPDKPDWGVTITKDFKTFIFSSGRDLDKPHSVREGGYGDADLYVVEKINK